MDKFHLNDFTVVVLCVASLMLTLIVSIAWYNMHDRGLMADNMNRAIEKGIDPLSVRCSYVQSQDIICVSFAASAQSHNVAQQASSRK